MAESDLVVLVKFKDYLKLIYLISEKSPKKYRFTLSSKLENYALEALTKCVEANEIFINKNTSRFDFEKRIRLQTEAHGKLRVSGYLLQIAEEVQCILFNQFEKCARLLDECIKILISWKNSDMKRLRDVGVER